MSEQTSVPDAERRLLGGSHLRTALPGPLALPATGTEVAQFVAMRAAACVGADYSNIAALDERGEVLRLFHGAPLAAEIVERYTDVSLSAPFPIAAAARSGTAILLADLDAYRVQYPLIVADTMAAGIQATASLPLYRENGTLVGAIGFGWSAPITFDVKLQSALQAVAELCTAAIERAERYDADHRFLVELSANLLGELPVMAGLDTAARYVPASETVSVGGDWYEGLLLDRQRLALVVGDVAGHGLSAAADMALLRGMITALLHSGVAIADVFAEMSHVLLQRPGVLFATAALVIVDVADGTLMYATAGHPPPLVQLPIGEVRRLDGANAPIIGGSPTRRTAATMAFPVGSRLVMFTDGLVENRDRPFDAGIDQLASSLSVLPRSLSSSDLTDALLRALLGNAPSDDDIAVVTVQRTA
jgi:serine phosphatase RsbU (regulator of sigma subunit)